MRRETSSGSVVFRCPCGIEELGRAEDARIGGAILDSGETYEMYHRLIQTAPFDRTNQLVQRPCPSCGLDFLTQIRVGGAEVIIYTCECGHEEVGGDQPVATDAGLENMRKRASVREQDDRS